MNKAKVSAIFLIVFCVIGTLGIFYFVSVLEQQKTIAIGLVNGTIINIPTNNITITLTNGTTWIWNQSQGIWVSDIPQENTTQVVPLSH
jgi:preprotein translocase subunit YajC